MPIRFRCAYCNQLMGISHRKMGTIVRCPKCSGQVVVPQIEDAADDDGPQGHGEMAAVKALEDPELEMLLAGAAHEGAGQGKRKAKRKGPPKALLEIDVEPYDPLPPPFPAAAPEPAVPSLSALVPIVPPPANSATAATAMPAVVTLPRWVIGGVAAVILLLLGLAFLVGFVLGKQAAH